MTTKTRFPQRVATVPEPDDSHPTESLEPAAAEVALDALPLLDHRARTRTIAPRLALPGSYLALHDGPETRLLPIRQKILHVGRGSEADVRFEDHRVSRDHAIFVRHGRIVRLLDNRSSNGTFINGRRIVATNISDGDVICVGPVVMQYREVR